MKDIVLHPNTQFYKSFTIEGFFFLPQSPEDRLAGYCTYDNNEGVRVFLYGRFHSLPRTSRHFYSQSLLGIDSSGQAITLFHVSLRSSSGAHHPSLGQTVDISIVFAAEALLLGIHAPDPDQLLVNNVAVSFDRLSRWLGMTGLSEFSDSKTGHFTIKYTPPKEAYSIRDNNETLEFSTSTYPRTMVSPRATGEHLVLFERASVVLNFAHPAKAADVVRRISELQRFFSFAGDTPFCPVSVSVGVVEGQQKDPRFGPVSIYYYFGEPFKYSRTWSPHIDSLFTFDKVKDRLSDILYEWKRIESQMGHILSFHISNLFVSEQTASLFFFTYALSLEATHSCLLDDTRDLSRADHRARIEAILKACPAEHAEWLKPIITNANKKPYRKKLAELIDKYGACLIAPNCTADDLARWIKKFRDDIAHGNPLEQTTSDELLVATNFCRLLLQSILLRTIGFDDDYVISMAKRKWQYRQFVSHHNSSVSNPSIVLNPASWTYTNE